MDCPVIWFFCSLTIPTHTLTLPQPLSPPLPSVADVDYTSDAKVFADRFVKRVSNAIPTSTSVLVQRLYAADDERRRTLLQETAMLGVDYTGAPCTSGVGGCEEGSTPM